MRRKLILMRILLYKDFKNHWTNQSVMNGTNIESTNAHLQRSDKLTMQKVQKLDMLRLLGSFVSFSNHIHSPKLAISEDTYHFANSLRLNLYSPVSYAWQHREISDLQ